MLRLLQPDQVSIYWTDIRATIQASIVPLAEATDETLNLILEAILREEMQVWAILEEVEGETNVKGVAVTYINVDVGTQTKNIVVYSLCGYSLLKEETWWDGLEGLKSFARRNGCVGIVGYTKVPRIKEIVEKLGGKAEYVFVELEV